MGPFTLLWVAALGLPQSAPEPEGLRIYSPAQFGVTAETPSRMPGSRGDEPRPKLGHRARRSGTGRRLPRSGPRHRPARKEPAHRLGLHPAG
jgi:hypothetical protein